MSRAPTSVRELADEGIRAQKTGNLALAEKRFREVVQREPKDPNGWHLLGRLAYDAGRYDKAVEFIKKAVAIRDTVPEYHRSLAAACMGSNDPDGAMRAYRKILRLNPNDVGAACALGNILTLAGRLDEAVELFEGVVERDPESDMARGGLSIALQHRNDMDRAVEVVEPVESAEHHHEAYALAYGRLGVKKRKDPTRAEAILRTTLEKPDLPVREREGLLFRLADLLHAEGRTEEAFAAYEQANSVNPTRWNPDSMSQYVEQITQLFAPGCMETFPRSRNPSELPVFIVGMPRSGTSLVEQILASHPDVHGAGELRDIGRLMDELPSKLKTEQRYPLCHGKITTPFLDKVAKAHVSRLKKLSKTAQRVTDKMPTNFVALGFIAQAFPKCRVIHCVRNPLDTCLSCYFTPFSFGHIFAKEMGHLGRYYADYRRLMDHWTQVLDIPILDVVYEDLVADQDAQTRRMIDHLGLDWDDACLRFHESDRYVNTASFDQVRQPIYKSSVARHVRYDAHLGALRDALADLGRTDS